MPTLVKANELELAVQKIESQWAHIHYSVAKEQQPEAYKQLFADLKNVQAQHPNKAELIIQQAIIVASNAENISAVIHSNQATIGKFLRMGYLAEFGRQDLDIKFVGQAIYDNNQAYIDFEKDVGSEEYEEYWKDSITIYHNPYALCPLDYNLFPNVAHVFFTEGKFNSIKPKYYPVRGRTYYRAKEI